MSRRILIENSYITRRPFSPGNPNGRRGISFSNFFPYAAGLLTAVDSGLFTATNQAFAAPNNTTNVVSPGIVTGADPAAFASDVILQTNQPAVNLAMSYSVSAGFTFIDQTSGLSDLSLWTEINTVTAKKRTVEIHGGAGGFVKIQAHDENGFGAVDQFVDIGLGAGILPAGLHVLTATVSGNQSGSRTLAIYVDRILQYTGQPFISTGIGNLFGFILSGANGAPGTLQINSFGYTASM